jgi:hypothetical protein
MPSRFLTFATDQLVGHTDDADLFGQMYQSRGGRKKMKNGSQPAASIYNVPIAPLEDVEGAHFILARL